MLFRLFRQSDGNHWDVEAEDRGQALEKFGERLQLELSYVGRADVNAPYTMGPVDSPDRERAAVWTLPVGAKAIDQK